MGSNSLILGFLCLFLFHFQSCLGQFPLPTICSKQECPPYKVIHTQNEFEIRAYTLSSWILTPITTSKTYKDAVRQGFITLFNYIRGNNPQHVEWDMTAPVLIDILPNSSFNVSFYVPQKFQNNVPTPYDSQRIQSVKLPKNNKYAAVIRFSGYLDDVVIADQLAVLRKTLQGNAEWKSAASSTYYSATDFNPPWKVKDRVNEIIIWFDQN